MTKEDLRKEFTATFSTFLSENKRGINPYVSCDGVFDWLFDKIEKEFKKPKNAK